MDLRSRPAAPNILRSRLLAAIAALAPRIVVCSAPAGYGKSVLARQIGAQRARSVICDCAGSGHGQNLAQLLVAALACEAAVSSEDADEPYRAAQALRLWSRSGDPEAAFIFENAEALDREGLELLRACLANPGSWGVVVVCTRSYVNIPFSRNLPPTAIMTIGETALSFSPDEIAELVDADASTVQRIAERTARWPIEVSVFQKAAQLGSLESLFDDPDHVELRRLDGYIGTELIEPLRVGELDLVCLLSLVPEMDSRVAAVALGLNARGFQSLLRGLPMVERRRHALSLHPLLARHLALHHVERRTAVAVRASELLLTLGERATAARIALAAGEKDRAAAAVDPGVLLVTDQPVDIADYAVALDGNTLVGQPRLWSATLLYRVDSMTPDQWRNEGFAVWKRLAGSTDRDALIAVANSMCVMLVLAGSWEEFERFRADAARRFRAAGIADDPIVRVLDVFWNGWLDAARLQPLDVESFMSAISSLLTNDYVHAIVLREIVARVRAYRGNRALERDTLDEAVRRAARSGIPAIVSYALQKAALSAWIAGEQALVELYFQELRELTLRSPEALETARHLLACADGDALTAPAVGSRPVLRAFAILVGAHRVEERSVRGALIRTAIEAADHSRHLAPMMFTRLAAAASDPRERYRLDEIRKLLVGVPDGTIFHEALEKFDSKGAQLDAFLDRFRPPAPVADPVRVELLSGSVRRGNVLTPLSVREFGLLAFLAVQPRPVSIDVVVDVLWPNASVEDGTASVRVYVNRIRKRIGDPSVIVSAKRAYGVGAHVSTDIAEFERVVAGLPESATRPQIEAILGIHDTVAAGFPSWLVDLPGMTKLNARVNPMVERLLEVLARSRDVASGDLRARVDAVLHDEWSGAATA